ncbi:MAG: hypothetical protein AAF515_03335 [Pseudomonadota bacterium]
MANTTLYTGLGLIVLGIISYLATGQTSITALIPAFFGIALGIAGLLARRENLRKHLLHVAAAVALLGIVGSLMRAGPALLAGDALRVATAVQLIMGVVLLVYLVLCIRSFIAARRAGG